MPLNAIVQQRASTHLQAVFNQPNVQQEAFLGMLELQNALCVMQASIRKTQVRRAAMSAMRPSIALVVHRIN